MTTDHPARNLTDDPLVGQQLGDYSLRRLLATGGIARIYEAEDTRLARPAAVKVLSPEKLEHDPSLAVRFEREARVLAALEHQNIIRIYQFGEQDGLWFMALNLVVGRDLAQVLKLLRSAGERMPVERALHILGQVAAALDYAHAQGVVHRDVKPSNILLDYDDRATLTDFGLVMNTSIETTMGTAFGTPRYISPEQAIASSQAVPQSDVYSLAIILYECLTGETPFSGDTPMALAMNHVTQPPRPPRQLNPDIPPAAETEILRALDKEPARRQASAGALVQAVASGFRLAPAATDVPSAATGLRRGWLVAAGSVIILLLWLLSQQGR